MDTNDDPDGHFEGDLLELLRHVDIFLPNRREACMIAKTDNLEAALKELSGIVPLVVVKLGAEGAIAIRKNERTESAALKVEMVDPVGAGDSFDAGFLHAYLRGGSLKECINAGTPQAPSVPRARAERKHSATANTARVSFASTHRSLGSVEAHVPIYCGLTSNNKSCLNSIFSFAVWFGATWIVPRSLLSG